MNVRREKVVVAMSGGVDSSVAACLLVEQGYEVVGLFMRTGVSKPVGAAVSQQSSDSEIVQPESRHRGCCSASDAADARRVAGMLDVPFYALNFEKDFDTLIDYFADEYAKGRTPNPCVICNDRLKFGRIVEYADAVGAKYIATGHFARIGQRDGESALLRGVDSNKDQSYVLFGLDRAILGRLMFPIGGMTKAQIREAAQRIGLPNHDKPDSVDICFVPDGDYARVVRERRPDAFVDGDVLDEDGSVIGQHQGIARYTIGQRRGLGIAAGKPVYVTSLDVLNNTVTLGDGEALFTNELTANRSNFLCDVSDEPFRAEVKIRYLHKAAPATVERIDGHRMRVVFDTPQRAVTPGQAVVVYDGDVVLGGAWIEQASRSASVTPPSNVEAST